MLDLSIEGFTVRAGLSYELRHHMWVEHLADGNVRIGMDALGVETSGTLAQLEFLEPGTVLTAGDAFGSLEAEKFVGPLVSPLSGTVSAVNRAAVVDPGLVEREPYDSGWMIELSPSDPGSELDGLVAGDDDISREFAQRVAAYRRDGVLAE